MIFIKKPLSWLHRLYDMTLHLSSKENALFFLCLISFAESSFFPIPPDLVLIPLILARPKKAYKIALYCTLSSIIGAYFGYYIGHALYEPIALPILNFYDAMEAFQSFEKAYLSYGAWIVAGAGFTPFPYKVITITSGVVHLNLWVFTIASVLSRGGRFFLIAWLLKKYGEPMNIFIRKNLGWLSTLFFILLIGSFLLIKYF